MHELKQLIQRFASNINQYKNKNYDEANTRTDFIDPFFELLGWDIANKQGFAEQFREVVREDSIKIHGKTKAPDYSFRIGGRRIFFVEAKKPSVDLNKDIAPAYQLRRYAYTAGLPLSILTDFEEFSIYDTRIKPSEKDKASTARIFYCPYNKLLNPYNKEITNFEYIYNLFSRKAIQKGSFDKFDAKKKKGTSGIDKDFLNLIEQWRSSLARNIAIRNENLSVLDLNYAVQKIIDRIIFLRIAEDKNTETYGTLQDIINTPDVIPAKAGIQRKEKNLIYKSLDKIFKKADKKYNSGLFAVYKWISDLTIDDKILKDILQNLYYPKCPYEFSVFPIEILGRIYEQFLGKTIRLTAGGQARIEEKPEVRRAGGVYYTPQYIVDYIVKNTVGEKAKNKKPKEIEKLKILDPACGSGSFLVGAYDYLLNYHLEYYLKNKNKSIKDGKLYRVKENDYRLSIAEKQKILLNNIYGVDIDSQAVEVAKLSLLLKLMESENLESEGQLFKHSDFRILPDLSGNIKCGNSLIASDFYDNRQQDLFGDEDIEKINAFDWEKEFPAVFASSMSLRGVEVTQPNPCHSSPCPSCHSRTPVRVSSQKSGNLESEKCNKLKVIIDSNIYDELDKLDSDSKNMILSKTEIYSTSIQYQETSKIKSLNKINKSFNIKAIPTATIFPIAFPARFVDKHSAKYITDIAEQTKKRGKPDINDGKIAEAAKHYQLVLVTQDGTGKKRGLYQAASKKGIDVLSFKEFMHKMHNTSLDKGGVRGDSSAGFDCVIGNPPYVNIVNIKETERRYLQNKYSITKNKVDLYAYFIEKAIYSLLKTKGLFGYIVSNTWLATNSFHRLRKLIFTNGSITNLCPMPLGTFRNAKVETVIFIFEKSAGNRNISVLKYEKKHFVKTNSLKTCNIIKSENLSILPNMDENKMLLLNKLSDNNSKLGSFLHFSRGVKTSNDKKFVLTRRVNKDCYKLLRGKNIQKYVVDYDNLYLWYRPDLMKEKTGSLTHTKEVFLEKEKIIMQGRSGARIIATLDTGKYFVLDTAYFSKIVNLQSFDIKYFVGLVNCKVINFWYGSNFKTTTVSGYELHQLPIPKLDLAKKPDKQKHDKIVSLVGSMLTAQKRYYAAKSENDKKTIKKKIDIIDNQIDRLVYGLYGLTAEEIGIIENG